MNRVGDKLLHVGANKELIHAFTSGSVEFIVVGGLAVSWYCCDRKADDMDLLVNPTHENSARIARALDSLRMQGYSDRSFAMLGLQVPLKQVYYAELLTPQRDGPTYADVEQDAVDAKLFEFPVRVASAAVLIELKRKAVASAEAQRDKHMMDIERLKKYAAV